MKAYRKIERLLESLHDSTDLTVELCGETVSFTGLNSPYTSHQHVVVTHGHGVPRLVIFRRPNREPLAIVPQFYGAEMFDGPILKADLPSYYIKDLFRFPASRPDWVEGIICAIVPDSFRGYSEVDGEAEFRTPEVLIKYDWRRLVFCELEPLPDDIVEIGCKRITKNPSGEVLVGGIVYAVGSEFSDIYVAEHLDEVNSALSEFGVRVEPRGYGKLRLEESTDADD